MTLSGCKVILTTECTTTESASCLISLCGQLCQIQIHLAFRRTIWRQVDSQELLKTIVQLMQIRVSVG